MPQNSAYTVNYNEVEEKPRDQNFPVESLVEKGKLAFDKQYKPTGLKICRKLKNTIPKLTNKKNWESFLTYDTVWTSGTHHMIENRQPAGYLNESELNPRTEMCRYEIIKNVPNMEMDLPKRPKKQF